MLKHTKIVGFALVFLFFGSLSGYSQDDLSTPSYWTISDFRTTGISKSPPWQLVGTKVIIEDEFVSFSNGEKCSIGLVKKRVLGEGMRTFGSGGGNWKDIGFSRINNVFEVRERSLNCQINEYIVGILSQNDNLVVLDFGGRVFGVLSKSSR